LEKEAVAKGRIRWALWIPSIVVLGLVTNTIQGLTHMGGYGCIYGLGIKDTRKLARLPSIKKKWVKNRQI
jgi:hypothetical protein